MGVGGDVEVMPNPKRKVLDRELSEVQKFTINSKLPKNIQDEEKNIDRCR